MPFHILHNSMMLLQSKEVNRFCELPRQPQPLTVARSLVCQGRFHKRVSVVCNSDPRGRTKWYGNYTEEQYLAQRQSEERARWAANVRTITGNLDQAAWSREGSPLDPPALLGGVTVVIISPRKPVTVGTVARACGSFECEDLRIVMPRQESYITRHAKSASKGAQYILYRAGHYDSIAEATSDCDVRVAFTRWAQSSSPHVYKVDISDLISHPAVRRVLEQPLQRHPAAELPPPSSAWSAAAAAAAEAAEARLMAAETGAATLLPLQSSTNEAATGLGFGHSSSSVDVSASGNSSDEDVSEGGGDDICTASGGHSGRDHHQSAPAALLRGRDVAARSSGSGANGVAVPLAAPADSLDTCGGPPSEPPLQRAPKVALVFGREELGMSDDEVDSCEVCCSVPIGRLQESLSLSHAVSIALCTLYQARLKHLAAAGSAAVGGAHSPALNLAGIRTKASTADSEARPYGLDASTGAVGLAT